MLSWSRLSVLLIFLLLLSLPGCLKWDTATPVPTTSVPSPTTGAETPAITMTLTATIQSTLVPTPTFSPTHIPTSFVGSLEPLCWGYVSAWEANRSFAYSAIHIRNGGVLAPKFGYVKFQTPAQFRRAVLRLHVANWDNSRVPMLLEFYALAKPIKCGITYSQLMQLKDFHVPWPECASSRICEPGWYEFNLGGIPD